MFSFFRKKKNNQGLPELIDLNNEPLKEGDMVEALRYDLGECKLLILDGMYTYESVSTGNKASWLKMIDASTECQKVRKIK